MPLPKSNNYTIEDIYSLPDGQRAELIDGQIYDMAPPSPFQQEPGNGAVRNSSRLHQKE